MHLNVTYVFTGAFIMLISLLSLKVTVRRGQKGELVIEVNLIIPECLVTCGHLAQVLTAPSGGWLLRRQEQRRREL